MLEQCPVCGGNTGMEHGWSVCLSCGWDERNEDYSHDADREMIGDDSFFMDDIGDK